MRSIITCPIESGSIEFPHLQQACCIERIRRDLKGKLLSTETVYAITSLNENKAGPEKLLQISRQHWGIENKIHYVRDVTLGEDFSRIRKKNGPQAMACFRNLVIGLLNKAGSTNIAKALRECQWNKPLALQLVGISC